MTTYTIMTVYRDGSRSMNYRAHRANAAAMYRKAVYNVLYSEGLLGQDITNLAMATADRFESARSDAERFIRGNREVHVWKS